MLGFGIPGKMPSRASWRYRVHRCAGQDSEKSRNALGRREHGRVLSSARWEWLEGEREYLRLVEEAVEVA